MADVTFWDLEERLVATIGDGAAVWEESEWRTTSPAHACKAQVDGQRLTAAEATKLFPGAVIGALPIAALEAMDAAAVADYEDEAAASAELDAIEADIGDG